MDIPTLKLLSKNYNLGKQQRQILQLIFISIETNQRINFLTLIFQLRKQWITTLTKS
jgi:hypothetical protein